MRINIYVNTRTDRKLQCKYSKNRLHVIDFFDNLDLAHLTHEAACTLARRGATKPTLIEFNLRVVTGHDIKSE